MADVAKLKGALQKAEAKEKKLLDERKANRQKMSKADFMKYNEETKGQQIAIQQEIREAQDAITEGLNLARQELFVGTVDESNSAGGTS